MERLASLRKKALEHPHDQTEFFYRFYKRFQEMPSELPLEQRYSAAYEETFSHLTPHITEGELIVGEIVNALSEDEMCEWREIYEPYAKGFYKGIYQGQDSHMAIDYERVLKVGLSGILAEIKNHLSHCDESKKAFYLSCKTALLSVMHHTEAYADHAEALARTEQDPTRKAELTEIARICRRVPAHPAESFYEAVQSVHFITYCLSLNPLRLCPQQFQLGHPDRYLLPYYEKDIREGKITKEKAGLLLDCLGIQINMRVPNGLSSGYMVGGRDANGNIVENDLTEMCMQVIDDIRLVYPAVGLCYTNGMSDYILEKACAILSKGRSHPAIFNDDVITEGLRRYGVPEAEAHDYIHSTCVEITPVASSNVWVASPYTNMVQLLLDTMTQEYDSFEAHFETLIDRLDLSIERNFNVQNQFRKMRAEKTINPLLSTLVNDCLKRGLDIERGGARYHWIMPSFVGMANLVDALYVLKTLVYEKKELTVTEFKKILDEDFEGNEALRLHILQKLPKYGNDIDELDETFGRLTNHIVSECKKYKAMHTNGNLIPSVFCWVMHEYFGRKTGASPDGRKAGFPLGDGSGPCQGREMNGPTASILSSTKWDHSELIGGVAVNMKFSKSALGKNALNVMKTLIKVYLQRGGFEMQINVTDKALLEDARKNPEAHRDLVVRIGGYSDYFVKLSPQMQDEIILRTEHHI